MPISTRLHCRHSDQCAKHENKFGVFGAIYQKCRSFTNMDINVWFSVIFQLTVFGEINEQGKSLFVSRYHFVAGAYSVKLNCELSVNFMAHSAVNVWVILSFKDETQIQNSYD